jgi:hypothetical protein
LLRAKRQAIDNAARRDEITAMLAAAYRGETLEEFHRNYFGKD